MLLHERLRKWGSDAFAAYNARSYYGEDDGRVNSMGRVFKKMADEIEHNYIDLPRDQEGIPWMIGDSVEYPAESNGDTRGIVTGYRFSGKWYLLIESPSGRHVQEFASDCERPGKVLDADGVEIKVSDEVYSLLNDGEEPFGTCYVVTAIDTSRELPVSCGHWGQREWIFKGTSLTHREPDSMSKAMERFESILDDGDGLNYEAEDNLREVYHRLTALIERGA